MLADESVGQTDRHVSFFLPRVSSPGMLDATVLVRKTVTLDRFSVFREPCASAFAFQLFEKACLCAAPG